MSSNISSSEERSSECHDADAADFLFSNTKYHDCFLVVGNPDTDEVESIGAESIHLIAHSPVFREMLEHNRVKDPSESRIHVTDVSPATFKLMLRYVYGGKLPRMTAIEAAGLALCADKFKIPRLVQKALKRLNPKSAEDVFPALVCISYINFPDLELKVAEIIQQETDKIVESFDFLELDEDCVIFIMKQNTLNISELELWKSVTRWAEYQVKLNPHRTIRDCLVKILGYVRLLTFSLEDIAEHVLPTKIITPEEFVDLTLTLTKKQTLESPLLCKIQEKRGLYKEDDVNAISPKVEAEFKTKDYGSLLQNNSETVKFVKSCIFKTSDHYNLSVASQLHESTFSIKPIEPIEIVFFTCGSVFYHKIGGCPSCEITVDWRPCQGCRRTDVNCHITITKTVKDIVASINVMMRVEVVKGDNVILPVKLESGHPLVLNPEETWTFTLEFDCRLCVYKLSNSTNPQNQFAIAPPLNKDNITFANNLSSVVQIGYRKQ